MTTGKIFVGVALIIMMACAPMSAMAQAKPQLPSQSDQSLSGGIEELAEIVAGKLATGDLAGAGVFLDRIVSMEDFNLTSDDFRARIHLSLALVRVASREFEEAMKLLDLAAPLAEGMGATYWPIYMNTAVLSDHMDKAVHAGSIIAVEMPELMSTWREEVVLLLLDSTRKLPEAKTDRIVVLDALWRTGFSAAGLTMEYYYQDLLDARIAQGDLDAARQIARTLKGPDAVQQMSTNAAYADFAPVDIDTALVEAFEATLRPLHQAVEESPNLARPVVTLATWLNHAGRQGEALDLVDAALARVADSPIGVTTFDDQVDQLEWLHNARSRTLMNLGRWGDALEAQIAAQKVAKAVNRDAVSQSVNLGEIYLLMGKPELAADAIADADPERSSDYGRMSIQVIQACAAQELGKVDEAKTLLSSMRGRVGDAPEPLFWAMLCANEVDELAGLVADRLGNQETRRSSLEFLQRYLLPAHPPAFFEEMEARKETLRSHHRVQAALEDAGKIMDWQVFN